MTTTTEMMTLDEMLALPDQEKFDRWLIRGELREQRRISQRPTHASATAAVTGLLGSWLSTRLKPRPKLYNGDIFFRVSVDPESNLGADVALAPPEQAAATGQFARCIEGPPLLVAEVLSPSDTTGSVDEKIEEYLTAKTPLVWIVDPYAYTVTIFRPDEEPVLFNRNQELCGDPHLPGFRVRVAEFFA